MFCHGLNISYKHVLVVCYLYMAYAIFLDISYFMLSFVLPYCIALTALSAYLGYPMENMLTIISDDRHLLMQPIMRFMLR